MAALFLLAEIAGTEVAIASEAIESIIAVGETVAVPHADPIVVGLCALRSRVLTLIDCQYRVTGTKSPTVKGSFAAIVGLGGHSFGLMVDKVFDVIPLPADAIVPAKKLGKGWADIVTQLGCIDGRLVMIVDPEALVSPQGERHAA